MGNTSSTMGEQVLGALGLDTICVQVYLMMHSAPEADAEQIAERLGIEAAEVVDALDELSDLTLLRPGLSPAQKLRPVSIERAIHTLIRQQSEQLKIQSGSLSMLQSAMKELLESRPTREDGFGHADVEALTGAEPIQSWIERLVFRATESVWSTVSGRPMPPEVLEAARPFDQEVAQRGVPGRSLYQNSVLADRRNLDYARWLSSLGPEIRSAAVVPIRMTIVDRSTAAVLHKQPQLPMEMFVVREPALVIPLVELFEASWASAASIDGPDPKQAEEKEPSQQELGLLRLLASGSTDEAAAKKLGVSVRTVRRIMAELMDQLEASSRFEAGHKATQRGWL
jgi:DNA-binding CsgD family transcriptional regulator/predicted transcriptional regulator